MNPPSGKKPQQKVRFAPKAPKKLLKPVVPKVEKVETVECDDARAQEMMRRFSESSKNLKGKTEKKGTNVQVAFGYGGTSTNFRSSGSSRNSGNTASGEKEYQEPWDYYSNYPLCLPLRRPYAGNPEHLNEEEFGEASQTTHNNGNTTSNAATDLDLMEENLEPRCFIIQLPNILPLYNSQSSDKEAGKSCKFSELPAGYMGKMLVYESGAVKLKLGETPFNVYEGLMPSCSQYAVAVEHTKTGICCPVAELNKVVIVVPDVDTILDSMI